LISKQNRPVIYILKLLPNAKVHSRFYISKLELADPATLLQQTFRYKEEEENKYKVEQILNYKTNSNLINIENYYLVKWLGYNNLENI
jgi:hypothetical protein